MRAVGIARWLRANPGIAAIVTLALAWGLVMHSMGWAQSAHYAQVRALSHGEANIDQWHWETRDKAWIDGHFYSVKAPGLPLMTLPAFLGAKALNGKHVARTAVVNARDAGYRPWGEKSGPPWASFGFNAKRAHETQRRVQLSAPMVWFLTLFGATLPALALLLLVRWVADRIEPGFGTAAAITLGVGTIVMTFASEYFSHAASAALGFGAFALLFREREGPERLRLVALAGLVAGVAVTFEYPLFLAGAVLFAYALARRGRRVARGAWYAAGAFVGALPALLFNLWALGSPFKFAYSAAVEIQGRTGHAKLGLNDAGFFGITAPRPGAAVDLLLAGRGLVTLTPVLVMGLVGTVMMRRGPRRTEANVILAIAVVYFTYNTGYWLPFGGGSPGPRFLIPAMPFVAVGLAAAYRRLPAITLALAIPSAAFMTLGMFTFPLLGEQGTWIWVERVRERFFEHTLFGVLGVGTPWLSIAPVLALIAAAVALAAVATPATRIGDIRPALAAAFGWALLSFLGPTISGDAVTPLDGGRETVSAIAIGAAAAAVTLIALRYRERRSERTSARLGALGEPIS
jgi:hypothetical protein